MGRCVGAFAKIVDCVSRHLEANGLKSARPAASPRPVNEQMIVKGAHLIQTRHGGSLSAARITAFHCWEEMEKVR
jgi:hypothetical protein